MRLWHQKLIKHLPRQQLLGQHRECCALRGKGWGKNHSTVNYVFKYNRYRLYVYHYLVMEEMRSRGYNVTEIWYNYKYCGEKLGIDNEIKIYKVSYKSIYPEHYDEYLQECLDNLNQKGIKLEEFEE